MLQCNAMFRFIKNSTEDRAEVFGIATERNQAV
jgi:hypothetical protein